MSRSLQCCSRNVRVVNVGLYFSFLFLILVSFLFLFYLGLEFRVTSWSPGHIVMIKHNRSL